MTTFSRPVSLVDALKAEIGLPTPEPLTSIGALGRQFASEPQAPRGDWVPVYLPGTPRHINPAHTYVVKRLAETSGLTQRQAQRYTTPHGIETRGASKGAMAKMVAAAEASRAQYGVGHYTPSPRARELARRGGKVQIAGDYLISEVPEYRAPGQQDMTPDQWRVFMGLWDSGSYEEAAEVFNAEYADAYWLDSDMYQPEITVWESVEELTID